MKAAKEGTSPKESEVPRGGENDVEGGGAGGDKSGSRTREDLGTLRGRSFPNGAKGA